jgi:hypothetical protein
VEAFTFTTKKHDLLSARGHAVSDSALFLSPEDLTNAMAKAHEEKIRAMKDLETKKNAEIQVSPIILTERTFCWKTIPIDQTNYKFSARSLSLVY